MKRLRDTYHKIYSIENLQLADTNARRHKSGQPGILEFDKDPEPKLFQLSLMLKNKTYKTSAYKTFIVREPKERIVSMLPYWPDRIAHHAIMIHLEKMFTNVMGLYWHLRLIMILTNFL